MHPSFTKTTGLLPIIIALVCYPMLVVAATVPEPMVLFDFNQSTDLGKIDTQDAKVSSGKAFNLLGIVVRTGTQHPWPGITLEAPNGWWDLSRYGSVAVGLRNPGPGSLTVNCRVDNAGADGTKNCVAASLTLKASESGTLRVPLKRSTSSTLGGKLFGMRGYPVAMGGNGTIDPSKVTQVLLFLNKSTTEHTFGIDGVRAEGACVPMTASVNDAEPFFPFMDTFGQYLHKDWPGKTHSVAELKQSVEKEAKELAARPGPADWDKYGGWKAGPQLRTTGFFRTEKYKGKWWLVDPEGRLFFSHGVDCVRMQELTPVAERETWFIDFPGNDPEFKNFLQTGYCLKGHYAGKRPESFSFGSANLFRKYGLNWKTAAAEVTHRRLRSWGMNTIAMWSDEATRLMRKTTYVDAIGSRGAKMLEGSEGYWGKFPDVFDPSFAEGLRRGMAEKAGKSAGDPWCLGYFCDNEMSWGDQVSLALAALRSPATQAAKIAFVEDLKAKYGDIKKLNEGWGTTHESWEVLLADRSAPDQNRAAEDLGAFYTRTAEQYFKTVRDVIRAVAPNQLYLGCRFAWVNARAAAAAAKYCDVVSYNLYRKSVADFVFNGGRDVPLIIGEFHFGALDRGMFHTGLVSMADQQERAATYKSYVQGALRHPQFVGTHWFQYADEPTTGRVYDEENYQIGLVDVADTPYMETIGAVSEVGYGMYSLRLGVWNK